MEHEMLTLICGPNRMFPLADSPMTSPEDLVSSLRTSTRLRPTLLLAQHLGFQSRLVDLGKPRKELPRLEQFLKSKGEVGLLTDSQSDKPLELNPTKRPGTLKSEVFLAFCIRQ